MELLRILLMFMVLILHANFKTIGAPDSSAVLDDPFASFVRFFVQAGSLVCVNSFVLLSGWYGIRFSFKRLFAFLYQVLFFAIPIYLFYLPSDFNFRSIFFVKELFFLLNMSSYWFAKAYIILYVFSPVLNAFVDNVRCDVFRNILFFLLLLEILYGWLPATNGWYNFGYSPLAFINLYLLGRYMHKYNPRFCQHSMGYYLFFYFIIAFIIALLSIILSLSNAGRFSSFIFYLFLYSSPFTIFGSVSLVLFFSKIHIKSKVINWISSSSFSVYLLQDHPKFYRCLFSVQVKELFDENAMGMFVVKVLLFLLFIYILAVAIDQIRKISWHFLTCGFQIYAGK